MTDSEKSDALETRGCGGIQLCEKRKGREWFGFSLAAPTAGRCPVYTLECCGVCDVQRTFSLYYACIDNRSAGTGPGGGQVIRGRMCTRFGKGDSFSMIYPASNGVVRLGSRLSDG